MPDHESPSLSLSPLSVLDKARKEVPAVNYALGLAGIAAAASIIIFFVGRSTNSVLLLGAVFVGMILLFVFSNLINSSSRSNQLAGQFLMWAVSLFFIAFLAFTTSAMVGGWPCNWADFLGVESSCRLSDVAVKTEPPKPEPAPAPKPEVLDPEGPPESPQGRVRAFIIYPNVGGATAKRTWQRVVHDRWIEKYPNGAEAIFQVKRRTISAGCSGTVVANEDKPSFNVFIPDKGCPGMPFKIRNGNEGWGIAAEMRDVQ
jgi:hypothetical protein